MSYTKSKNRIDELLDKLGMESIIKAGGAKEIEKERERVKLSKELSLKNIELGKLPPVILDIPEEGLISLREHQQLVLNAFKKRRGLLVVHTTGSGKTYTGVICSRAYLKTFPTNKVVIISPKSLQNNFKNALLSFGVTDLNPYKFYTFSKFHNEYSSGEIDCSDTMLIVDEAHNLKAQSGSQAQSVIKCAKRANRVLLLTATPIINVPEDIKNLLTMIDGHRSQDKLFDENGFNTANDETIKKNFRCKLSFYEPSETEMIEHYPKKFEHPPVFLVMSPTYYQNYKFVEKNIRGNKDIVELFKDKSNLKIFFNGPRRAANNLEKENSPKVNWIMDKIKDSEPSDKFVIFSHFIEAGINLVKKRLEDLNIPFGYIIGSMNDKQRDEVVKKYNENKIKVLLISEAGGEGLDLKATRYLIVMEPDWNENNLNQVIGRAVRFNSHSDLPSYKRRVDIYKLYLLKPREFENRRYEIIMRDPDTLIYAGDAISVDLYLLNLSRKKQLIIDDYINKLKRYSIEHQDC